MYDECARYNRDAAALHRCAQEIGADDEHAKQKSWNEFFEIRAALPY